MFALDVGHKFERTAENEKYLDTTTVIKNKKKRNNKQTKNH